MRVIVFLIIVKLIIIIAFIYIKFYGIRYKIPIVGINYDFPNTQITYKLKSSLVVGSNDTMFLSSFQSKNNQKLINDLVKYHVPFAPIQISPTEIRSHALFKTADEYPHNIVIEGGGYLTLIKNGNN